MALAFVEGQSAANGTGVATTPAFTNTFALGQLVFVTIMFDGGANAVTSVVDNASTSNTYTLISGASVGNGTTLYLATYWAKITTAKASPTVTVNFNSAATNAGVVVQYFNGFVGTPTLDKSKSSLNTTSTTVTSTASTATTYPIELVIGSGVYAGAGSATTFSLGTGYTNLTQLNNSTDTVYAAMESLVTSSTGTQTATFTLAVTKVNAGGVVTFYDPSNTGGGEGDVAVPFPVAPVKPFPILNPTSFHIPYAPGYNSLSQAGPYVYSVTQQVSLGTTATIPLSSYVLAGDTIILYTPYSNLGNTTTSVTDTLGNNYVKLIDYDITIPNANGGGSFWIATNVKGGVNTVTLISSYFVNQPIFIIEVTNISPSPLDLFNWAWVPTASNQSVSPGNFILAPGIQASYSQELVLGFGELSSDVAAVGTGFTLVNYYNNGINNSSIIESMQISGRVAPSVNYFDSTYSIYPNFVAMIALAGSNSVYQGSVGDPFNKPLATSPAQPMAKLEPMSFMIPYSNSSGPVIQTFYQNVSGALGLVGNFTKSTNNPLNGQSNLVGNISRGTSSLLSGSLALAGTVSKQLGRSLSGALGLTGFISRMIYLGLTGIINLSGNLAKIIYYSLISASTGLSGAISRQLNRSLSGSLGFTGNISKQLYMVFSGATNLSGSIAKFIYGALTGSLELSGSITKNTVYSLVAGSVELTGAITKQLGRGVSGSLNLAGNINKSIYSILTGMANLSGSIARQTYYSFSGSLNVAGSIVKQLTRSLSGAINLSGAVSYLFFVIQAVAGSLSLSGSLAKQTNALVGGTINMTGILARQSYSALTATINLAGNLTKSTAYSLVSGTINLSGAFSKGVNKAYAGTVNLSGSLARQTYAIFAGTLNLTGSFFKFIYASLVGATINLAGNLTSVFENGNFVQSLTASLGLSGSLSKSSSLGLSGSLGLLGTLTKNIFYTLVGGTVNLAGSFATRLNRAVSGTLNLAGSFSLGIYALLSGSLALVGSIGRLIYASLTGSLGLVGGFSKVMHRTISGVVNLSGAVSAITAQIFYQALSGALGLSGSLTRTTRRSFSGSLGFIGSLTTYIKNIITRTTAITLGTKDSAIFLEDKDNAIELGTKVTDVFLEAKAADIELKTKSDDIYLDSK